MSANERKDAVFEAIRGGAEEYLVKPVTKKEVQNIWQHVWKRLSAAKLLREQQEVRLLHDWLSQYKQQPRQQLKHYCNSGGTGWFGGRAVALRSLAAESASLACT
jgi:YesN/AraC family two-component response regulator